MSDKPSKAALEREDDWCDYCERHCPAVGYWRCPVCDAEWHDDDDDTAAGFTITKDERA